MKLVLGFIFSILLVLISFFWIPVLSAFNVYIPKFLVCMQLIIVLVSAIPLAICVVKAKKKK